MEVAAAEPATLPEGFASRERLRAHGRLALKTDIRLRGQTPDDLLKGDAWAWHDLPSSWGGEPLCLPPGAMTVWSWNGKHAAWGTNTEAEMTVTFPGGTTADRFQVASASPTAWLSAVTFLGPATHAQPDSLVLHVANRSAGALRLEAC